MLTNDRIKCTSSPLTGKGKSQHHQFFIGQLHWINNMTKLQFRSVLRQHNSELYNQSPPFDACDCTRTRQHSCHYFDTCKK